MSLHLSVSSKEEATAWNFPLGIPGFRFADLNRVRRIQELDRIFLEEAAQGGDAPAVERLRALRAAPDAADADRKASAEVLIAVGRRLGGFVARLFHIEEAAAKLDRQALDDAPLFESRRRFVEKRVLKSPPAPDELAAMNLTELEYGYRETVDAVLPGGERAADPERELAEVGLRLLEREEAARKAGDAAAIASAARTVDRVAAWARALAFHPALRPRSRGWALFVRPAKLDFEELVERRHPDPARPEYFRGPAEHHRHRDGFDLTDPRMSARRALGETHYCLLCHDRGKDSCSSGFPDANGGFKKNPLGIPLTGCPLDERISEAHLLKREGHAIAALAMIMADNPLCAGTGHRICNDCMKSCIFQKQTPVDIPQAETRILVDVLRLPYGFEIYSLLTRWNPLNTRRPHPLPYNGKKVLVVGMGPAGYTLAHHLLNEGFGVVGAEGMKVEPLSVRMRGAKRRVPQPIQDIGQVTGPLDRRTILGFGGVSEYGITVRWDKNFLDVNYLVLMRRKKFRLFDGVRFGGTLTLEDAWGLGFDHVAIATGAGRPTLASARNNLLRGVRTASDFLMGLQGTGIYRKHSLGNLQVELPAVVIGGGLTAIDTATELQAYYAVQVEKTLERYERLLPELGEAKVRDRFATAELGVLDTWIRHGRAIRTERAAAAAAGRPPDLNRLIREWGGVTIAYRKRLQDAPAYRLNHEEVVKALEEGIGFSECLNPTEYVPGPDGAIAAVRFERQAAEGGKWRGTGQTVEMPARTLLVAAGTHPNVMYEKEHPGTFRLDAAGEFFVPHRLVPGDGGWTLAPARPGDPDGFFTSYARDGRLVTFFGDNHPAYAGNVVKAMASAKRGYREIARLFGGEIRANDPALQAEREVEWVRFAEVLDDEITATVVDVIRLTRTIVEVIVRAPIAARNFRPGQFYRLQNYESYAEHVSGFLLAMEGIALTGAWVDLKRGLLSLIVLEMGGSSRLCTLLEPGEKVVLMGPTGTPTEIPEKETVLLAGGGLGNAVLFSIAAALKAKNNRVLYFAAFRSAADLFKRGEIEKSCDQVVWSVDAGTPIDPRRPRDRTFIGNIVQAMEAYAAGKLGPVDIPLPEVDRLITIGSDRMMAAVTTARRTSEACRLRPEAKAIGSINSPMQCMMKEICAQCLQRHVDPASGKESFVFSCFNQDQPLDRVDFRHLSERLRQNAVAEKLTSLWIDHLFEARLVQEA